MTAPGPGTTVRIPVEVPGAPYQVVVGPGLLDQLGAIIPEAIGRVALVTNATVAALYGDQVSDALTNQGGAVTPIIVPDGEQAKSLEVLKGIYHRFAAIPLRRTDLVVALGGGVVTDLGGYAAATWHRGVDVVHVPTTLLAQVDAAVGGKTGVNLPEGKNLIGAFHQPRAVVADTRTLATLPERDRRAGMAEVVKCGFVADPQILRLLQENLTAAVDGEPGLNADLVARGVRVKARIVANDEREAGERELLNYGHTVGHAIEALTGYDRYRHGEAVALGMVFAARLGERLGVSDPGTAELTTRVLAGLGLPTGDLRLDPSDVLDVMTRDKKARTGVRFVLCVRPGVALLVEDPDRHAVQETLASLAGPGQLGSGQTA